MNDYLTFRDWAVTRTGIAVEEFEALKLATAFDLYVSRLEAARARGAGDPLETISPLGAGGNSRACTRRMLAHLDYSRAELRVIHRLMAGSASGWPGLIRLYAERSPLDAARREYVRRQVHLVIPRSAPCA
ncbi:hypothetical protein ACFUC1_02500 [Pedococcus sp. NPDC057267]|uniref:hypothetical protein n=1 Tax=Pedococcus sp. NPDC057267 TaxID=3346077 RepID=UPI003630391F